MQKFSAPYQLLVRCLRIVKKMTNLSKETGISKSTLTLISRVKGRYDGCMSTRMRLEAFLEEVSEPIKKLPRKNIT